MEELGRTTRFEFNARVQWTAEVRKEERRATRKWKPEARFEFAHFSVQVGERVKPPVYRSLKRKL
jgi:hypothetical protein